MHNAPEARRPPAMRLGSVEQRWLVHSRIIIMKLVHWPRVGCYIWYNEEEPGRAAAPPSPLLAVPNVTAHPSTASVPTSYYSMWTSLHSNGLMDWFLFAFSWPYSDLCKMPKVLSGLSSSVQWQSAFRPTYCWPLSWIICDIRCTVLLTQIGSKCAHVRASLPDPV